MGSDRGLQGEMSKIVYKVQEIGLSAGILAGRAEMCCLAVKTAFGGCFGRADPWKCVILRGKSGSEGVF